MSPRVRAVLNVVEELGLTEDERRELRAQLGEEDPCTPEEWESAWNDELARRIGEIERGEVELLSKDEFLARFLGD